MQGARGRYTRVLKSRRKIFIYLFWTIFIQGCPVQRGWFEWGPDEKKKTKQKKIKDKKIGTTKYSKSIGGSVWLGSKVPF